MTDKTVTPAIAPTSDDVSVLRVLLHTIQGSSPVSTTEFVTVPGEGE